jgi:hypothetical protein
MIAEGERAVEPRTDVSPISQAELADVVSMFSGVITRLRDFERRIDLGASIAGGELRLDAPIVGVYIDSFEDDFRQTFISSPPSLRQDRQAWQAGFVAGECGRLHTSCPYGAGSVEAWSWCSGHVEGRAKLQGYEFTPAQTA